MLRITTVLVASAFGLQQLSTDYPTGRALRVSSDLEFTSETTEMVRDGEPITDFRGGGERSERRRVQFVDTVLANDDGALRVERAFEDVTGISESTFGENERSEEEESPFDGIVVELVRDEDGDVEFEVTEGSAPEDEALEALRPELALDALLPPEGTELDGTWDLDDATLRRALGLDVDAHLFPRDEDDEDGGRRGRGRGASGLRSLAEATWEGTATLAALDAEQDGVLCARIALEIRGEGELPDPPAGGRGGRRERSFEPAPGRPERIDGSFEFELRGEFLFALEGRHPLLLELAGDYRSERDFERPARDGGSSSSMSITREGQLEWVVALELLETSQAVEASAKSEGEDEEDD